MIYLTIAIAYPYPAKKHFVVKNVYLHYGRFKDKNPYCYKIEPDFIITFSCFWLKFYKIEQVK